MTEPTSTDSKSPLPKAILGVVALILLLVLGAGLYVYMNLSNIAKNMTEDIASEALGVPVSIGSMTVDVPSRTVKVENLEIDNPDGFKKPHALKVKSISITASKLSRELLVFENINVSGTEAYAAVTSAGTNFSKIRENVAANSKKKPQNTAEPEEKVKVIIKDLTIAESTLTPALLLEDVDVGSIKVSAIEMSGIGEKENGVLAKEAIAQIWAEVSDKFNTSAAKAGMLRGLSSAVLTTLGVPVILEVPLVGDAIKGGAKDVGSFFKRNLFGGDEEVEETDSTPQEEEESDGTVNEGLKKLFDY